MEKQKLIFIILFTLVLTSLSFSASAQTSYGAEIISNQKFGEGLMVTRAKIVPISGVVSNMFFYNRDDQPWNGNAWYEYDWEMRGKYPQNGWSQIRVRSTNGGQLKDAPVNVSINTNVGNDLYNYILIRKGDQYVYDIRKDFNINNYDYTKASAHGGNSVSLIAGGPRIYNTGGNVADIPTWKQLDFSLGVTAFDNGWAGSLPNGSYSGEVVIDYTRFYQFSGNNLNTNPQWQDEFNGNSIDYSKWKVANWSYGVTQFTQNNLRLNNGKLYLKINRDSNGNASNENLALSGQASQSSTGYGGSANRAIDNNTNGKWSNNSVTHTSNQSNAWWQVKLEQNSIIDEIVVFNRTDNCCSNRLSKFKVSILNNAGSTVFSKSYTSPPNPSVTINTGGVTGRTVKVQLNVTNPLSLAEVQVIGTAENQSRELVVSSHFTAQKESGRKVELTWSINQIRNPIQYEIEHKNANGVFESLDMVAAVANHDVNSTFIHHSPEAGENIYRIKVIFQDYTVIYLEPKTIYFDAISDTKVFPNPTNGNLFIDLSDYLGEKVTMILTDPSGKVRFIENLESDHAQILDINISNFKSGFYMLYLKAKNHETKVEKISLISGY